MEKNMEIIRAISNSKMSDNEMIYYIQSYLLNWKTVEDIKRECPVTVKDYAKYYMDVNSDFRVCIWGLDSPKFCKVMYRGKMSEIPDEYKDYIVRNTEYEPSSNAWIFDTITKEEK